jgi:exonuclease VII small subunit
MAGTRNLTVALSTVFNDAGLKSAQKQLEGLGGNINKLSTKALKLGAAFAAFQGGRALVDFASNSIEQARDLTRNMNGLQAVFGELTPQMVEFTEGAHKMGLSQSEAAKSVTFIGSVLKQSGFAIGETAELTERLIGLGTDLSITFGYDVQEALMGMTALFRGEYDPIEKFGVAMKQSEIDAVKAARGLSQLTGSAERLADQQIRVELLFQRSADAQGMYAKSSDTLFFAQQNLEAAFKNLQSTAGLALTPAFTNLTLAMIPIVEKLTPAMAQIMQAIVPVVVAFAENTDQLEAAITGFANGVLYTVGFLAQLAKLVIENITLFRNLALMVIALGVVGKIIQGLTIAMNLLTASVAVTTTGFKALRAAIMTTGIGIAIVAVGFLVTKFTEANDGAEDFAAGLPSLNMQLVQTAESAAYAAKNLERFKKGASLRSIENSIANETFNFTPPVLTDPTETGPTSAGGQAKNYVADFYAGLKDEVAKQAATLKLEKLGATSGLIASILGTGDEWRKVFDDVIARGAKSVATAQMLFNKTAGGLQEITKKVEEANAVLKTEYEEQVRVYNLLVSEFEDFEKAANAAGKSLLDFVSTVGALSTFETAMGRFESEVVDNLKQVEEQLKDAFDNKQLLGESYKNLQSYARSEFSELQKIAKQRDDLLTRRNLAESLLKDVKNATVAAGNITGILQNTQTEVQKIDMAKVIQKTVQAGKNLKDFRVTIISDFVEPIEAAANKSQLLVSGFQAVVDRTRLFVANLKALRQLGLDPLLFNQLVEAGVEAGGETAQALIDGGASTVKEVNTLFGELDALGQELGEQTATVMYGQGQEFVNGIISGLDSMLGDLESTANVLADTFVTAFSATLAAGIAEAIAAAKAAMAQAPTAPDYGTVAEAVAEAGATLKEVAGVVDKNIAAVKKSAGSSGKSSGSGSSSTAPSVGVAARSIKDFAAFQKLSAKDFAALQSDKRNTSNLFATEKVPAFGRRPAGPSTTINLSVTASNQVGGAAAGKAAVAELSKFANSSGQLFLTNLTR